MEQGLGTEYGRGVWVVRTVGGLVRTTAKETKGGEREGTRTV